MKRVFFFGVQDRLTTRHLVVKLRSDSLRGFVCFIFVFEKCGSEKEVLKNGNPGAGKKRGQLNWPHKREDLNLILRTHVK